MRGLIVAALLLHATAQAQDPVGFSKTINGGKVERMDRWMKRTVREHRKGYLVQNGSSTYIAHQATYDTLVAFLRRQPAVLDAAWDRCVMKIAIWPGHSSIGMRWAWEGRTFERCWDVQEGKPGTLQLWSWRPQVRRSREHLRYEGAHACDGFVAEQRKHCAAIDE